MKITHENGAKKIFEIITIVLFLACITIPFAAMNFKTAQISEIDNKTLFEIKDIKKETFTTDVEKYVSDRIGFRDEIITAYVAANDALFGTLEHPTYTYGKDGHVFFNMPDNNFSKSYLKAFVKYIKKMQQYCIENEIDFLYCINPNKTIIYKDYLPEGANLTFERQNTLVQLLDKHNINYMDNTQLLAEAAKNTQVFNVKFDAGHWNETGAFIGMNNILKTLSQKHPEITVNDESDFTITSYINEYLPLSKLRIDEPTNTYIPNNPSAVDVTANDTDIIIDSTYNDYSHLINESQPELPRILVFRGSYFLGKEKFMADKFSESIFVHSYNNIFNMEYYIEKFNPDIVLFESVEYATINRYFPKDKLTESAN